MSTRGQKKRKLKQEEENEQKGKDPVVVDKKTATTTTSLFEGKLLDCPICFQILIFPIQDKCGHTICLACRNTMKRTTMTCEIKCPLCKTSGTFEIRNFVLDNLVITLPEHQKRMKNDSWQFSFGGMIKKAILVYGEESNIDSNHDIFELKTLHHILFLDILFYILVEKRSWDDINSYLKMKSNSHKFNYIVVSEPSSWYLATPALCIDLFTPDWSCRLWP